MMREFRIAVVMHGNTRVFRGRATHVAAAITRVLQKGFFLSEKERNEIENVQATDLTEAPNPNWYEETS